MARVWTSGTHGTAAAAAAAARTWAALRGSLLQSLLLAADAAWPAVATQRTLHLPNGVTTTLDPLRLDGYVHGGGGHCPWACGGAALQAIRGLATMQVVASAAHLVPRLCDAAADTPALVLTAPLVFGDLQVEVSPTFTLLGVAYAPAAPTLSWRGLRGTLTVTVPLAVDPGFTVWGVPTPGYVTDLAAATVRVVLDVTGVDGVTGAPTLLVPLINSVLSAGAQAPLQRLADDHVSALLEDELRAWIVAKPVADVAFPQAWLQPSKPRGSVRGASTACPKDGQAFLTPCDPCDTCCLCSTQGDCGNAACMAACGDCMPRTCARTTPVGLLAAGAAAALVCLLLLCLLVWGLVRGVMAAARHVHVK